MNILITGGLGYIGGRITDFLIKKNKHDITITTYPGKYIIPDNFNALEIDRVYPFAERFGIRKKFQEYFDKIFHASDDIGSFEL